MAANLSTLFTHLTQLNQLLDEYRLQEYWQQVAERLCVTLSPKALSLRLVDADPLIPSTVIRLGDLSPNLLTFFDGWEQAALTEWSGTATAWSLVDETDEQGDRALQVYLVVEQVLRGTITFLFTHECSADLVNTDELTEAIHFLAIHGLRAQHLHATRKQLDQIHLLYQISQAITSTLDLKTVFHQTTEMAASILQAQAATLFSIDTKQRELVFMVAKGAAAQALEEKRIPISHGVVGWVATHGQPLVVNNAQQSKLFNSTVDASTGFSTKNIVCVPLRIHDHTVGVLEVLNKEGEEGFTPGDAEWLTTMGQQIAIALENAQLYENLRQEQERIIKAQEEVRNQLARELHDNTAQMLSLIIMNLDLARQLLDKGKMEKLATELHRIEEYAKQANREVRTLLFELRPIILESRGLIPALHAYHRQLQASMDCQIHLDASTLSFEINLQGASIIFSIIQEAMNNIRKHARARNVWIRVHTNAEHLRFEVEDDGMGFDLASVSSNYEERGSFGLLNMRERAAMLGGYIEVQSPRSYAPKGTLIIGFIPLSGIIGR
ncbi:MAG: GAF domain-containing sensor histidine kinase [Caldilineaceae bacterium]|nr:GAF domain-containing sensor histidine kinase [Caldilineaceae bacterium]